MSVQEKYVSALEQQVMELTKDCYYLMSLMSTNGGVNTQDWPEGRKIVGDLDRSTAIFQTVGERNRRAAVLEAERRKKELERERVENRRRSMEAEERKLAELQKIAERHLEEISGRLRKLRGEIGGSSE